ncbi:MAG: type II secretion system protein GspD [Gammaproteobacteria bacterium]|nr:type II secretion system protein GspD [Gammaproteobacteria bacterium]
MESTTLFLKLGIKFRLASLLIALLLLVINPLVLRDSRAQNNSDAVTLNFEKADIEAFIATISQITGKSFIVDPRVKGRITVISGEPLESSVIYDIFLSVLEVHNFSAVESGDVVKIIPLSKIKGVPTRTSFDDPGNNVDEQITQIYQLTHISANELAPLLRPLLPPTSHFAVHVRTNTLIITDTVGNIRRVLNIVENIDKPNRHSDINIVFLKHARASGLAQVLSQLAAAIQLQTDPAVASNNQAKSVVVQAEPETNSLIIQAPPAEFAKLKLVIDQLDIDRNPPSNVHVLYLKHAKAKELTGILNTVIQNRSSGSDSANSGAVVSIQADEQNNALIIRAGEEDFHDLKTVVDKLDIRRAQVYVEMIIAEVTQGKESDVGVQWNLNSAPNLNGQTSIGGDQITGSTSFTNQTGGIALGFINRFVFDLAGNLVPDLGFVLRALRSNASANILSTPNLLTLDNETAEITVGQEVPFITGQFVSSASTTSTDTSNTGTTTGVVNPFQTIERKDVGLSLKITPQINDGDVIQLNIEQTVSNVSRTTLQGASDLVTDNRSIQTNVLVDDGQIIVLGGLIRDSVIDTYEYVPGLGKIPLLGALFRRKSKANAKTNLMVFLRPKVIRSQADMLNLTKGKYRMIRREEIVGQPDTRELIQGVENPVLPMINWETGQPEKVSAIAPLQTKGENAISHAPETARK